MREKLQQEAWQAILQGDYALAEKNWVRGMSLPDDCKELIKIFDKIYNINNSSPNADLCAILGLIALDYNEVFDGDRERALEQCVQWSLQGVGLKPEHYYCNRHAGSAYYWLGNWESAKEYYTKAIEIIPSPTLQIRLFNIENKDNPKPDFSELIISLQKQNAMEAYNAGVEINSLLNHYTEMPDQEKERLIGLRTESYAIAYDLYRGAIIENNGDLLNYDPHTFAMCCNNRSIEYRLKQEYEAAISVTIEGIEYSCFIEILQNRFGAYLEGNFYQEAIADGERLIYDFANQMDLITYFNTVDSICSCYMELKNYEEALEWIAVGKETYYSEDPTYPPLSDPDVVRCFTNFFIYEATARQALGIETDNLTALEEADSILENMPDNPSILISKAKIFSDEGDYAKALECYQYALHFATQQGMQRSVQVALYNIGYLQVVDLRDDHAAFENFEGSIGAGNQDFWCYYWITHCGYHLNKNEETVYYAQLALQALSSQEGVADSVIAEIYEHLGTSQLDLGLHEEAVQNLRSSLQYHETSTARENLKIAEGYLNNTSGGFFKKLFGN